MAAQQIPFANLTNSTLHVAFPEVELHSVRCHVCRNAILWLEDLMTHRTGPLAGLPLCPTHYEAEALTLQSADGRGAVVLVG